MFDHSLWDKVRLRLCANDAFPEPWDKVKSEPGIVDLSAEEAAENEEARKPLDRALSRDLQRLKEGVELVDLSVGERVKARRKVPIRERVAHESRGK